MKISIITILFLIPIFIYGQAVPDWISPEWTYSSSAKPYGWIKISNNPPEYKLYKYIEYQTLQIMSSPFDSTITLTIQLAVSGSPGYEDLDDFGDADLSGDGYNDIILRRSYASPYRYGVRIVNSVTGQDIFVFDDSLYSYYTVQNKGEFSWDIDNDGFNELIILRLTADYLSGNYLVFRTSGKSTSVFQEQSQKPTGFLLDHNYPNPFNPSTKIAFSLPSSYSSTLEIYDIAGRLIRSYSLNNYSPGEHILDWDGKSNQGDAVTSGTYFYRLCTESQSATKKMILLR